MEVLMKVEVEVEVVCTSARGMQRHQSQGTVAWKKWTVSKHANH